MKWENFGAFLSWLLRQEIFLTGFFLSEFHCNKIEVLKSEHKPTLLERSTRIFAPYIHPWHDTTLLLLHAVSTLPAPIKCHKLQAHATYGPFLHHFFALQWEVKLYISSAHTLVALHYIPCANGYLLAWFILQTVKTADSAGSVEWWNGNNWRRQPSEPAKLYTPTWTVICKACSQMTTPSTEILFPCDCLNHAIRGDSISSSGQYCTDFHYVEKGTQWM
jgi:hypothetical protein